VTLAGDPLRVVQRSVLRPTTLNVEPRPSRTSPSAEPTAADSGSALAPAGSLISATVWSGAGSSPWDAPLK
jgi:hypothetical protein